MITIRRTVIPTDKTYRRWSKNNDVKRIWRRILYLYSEAKYLFTTITRQHINGFILRGQENVKSIILPLSSSGFASYNAGSSETQQYVNITK